MSRKDFQRHNEPFTCEYCKAENPSNRASERNHCRVCLRSKHVDQETPGDRASHCQGRMEPVRVDYKGSKGYMIIHRCERCGKEIPNRAADDDQGIDRLI